MYELKALIAECAGGEPKAQEAFHDIYGPLIYTFPIRVFHLSREDAGDFYVYVFAEDRLFRRIKTFKGESESFFKAYLATYVLRHLFLEWRRQDKHLRTVSIDDCVPDQAMNPERLCAESEQARLLAGVLRRLEPEHRLVLKLLALLTVEWEEDEILWLAQSSNRDFLETARLLEEIREPLLAREPKAQCLVDELHVLFSRIYELQHRIAWVEEQLEISRQQGTTQGTDKFMQEKDALEHRLTWRSTQQRQVQQELQGFCLRPSHKDMARILKVPLGSISVKIARAREALRSVLAELDGGSRYA
jgi:RNA polymerase sigma factor (sigma-70 family)